MFARMKDVIRAGSSRHAELACLFSSTIYDRNHEPWKSSCMFTQLACCSSAMLNGASSTAHLAAIEITCACACMGPFWGPKVWHTFDIICGAENAIKSHYTTSLLLVRRPPRLRQPSKTTSALQDYVSPPRLRHALRSTSCPPKYVMSCLRS